MTNIETIIERLTRAHADMSREVKRATAYVLKNPAKVATHSMRRVSKEAGVTPPTMSRMVKFIGFDSYETFRDVYRNEYHYIAGNFGDRARDLQSRTNGDLEESLWSDLVEANHAHLSYLTSSVRPVSLKRAAERLLAARRVYVMGMLSSYSLASYLHYIARLALPNWHLLSARGSMLADEVASLSDKDAVIVIGFAPYARDTVCLAELARKRNASVIAITDELTSPLVGCADNAFVAPNDSPQYFGSYVATVVVMEALVAYVVSLGGSCVLLNIAKIEGTREVFNEYWRPTTSARKR